MVAKTVLTTATLLVSWCAVFAQSSVDDIKLKIFEVAKIRNTAFTPKELDDARHDVEALLATDLKALSQKEKAASDVAKKAELKAADFTNTRATRFLLDCGAVRLYEAAGDLDNARRVLVLMQRHFPIASVVEMFRESKLDLGVSCDTKDCPLLIKSLELFCAESVRMYGGAILENESVELSKLRLNHTSELSTKAKRTYNCMLRDPTRPWCSRQTMALACIVPLRNAIGGVKRVTLYFSYKTKILFEVAFMATYGSNIGQNICSSDMERLSDEIRHVFGANTYISEIDYPDIDKAIVNSHEKKLLEFKQLGDCTSWSYFYILSIYDFGVNDIRVDGAAMEDVHHVKTIEVRIVDEDAASIAYKEGENLAFDSRDAAYDTSGYCNSSRYKNFIESQQYELMSRGKKRSMALIGRGYDRGLYGMTTNRAEAVSWYAKAYAEGNVEAGERLKEMGESPDALKTKLKADRVKAPSAYDMGVPMADTNMNSPKAKAFANEYLLFQLEWLKVRRVVEQIKTEKDIVTVKKADLLKIRDSLVKFQALVNNDDDELKEIKTRYFKRIGAYEKNKIALLVALVDCELERRDHPVLNLCAIVNGERVLDARVVCNGKEYTTPATISDLKTGDKFGPYEVTYEKDGKKYGCRFSAITVNWTGEKTFTCTLKERK